MMRGTVHKAARAVLGLVVGPSVLVEPTENGELEISVSGAEDIPPFRLTPQAWATALQEALAECALSGVRARRQALGLTRAQLAARAGVHFETLGDLENGRGAPRADTVAAIKGALERFEQERAVDSEQPR